MITLYDVKLNKQKAKMIKQITVTGLLEGCEMYIEPLANIVVFVDSKG